MNDTDGKGIQGAVVSFDQLDFHSHVETKTDKKGRFVFLSLLHGEYRVTVKVDGKVRATRENYLISAGHQDASGEMGTLVFVLKPLEVFKAEQQKEAAKDGAKEEAAKLAAAREEQLSKQLARNADYVAGKQAMDAKQYDAAIDALKKAVAAEPKQPAMWNLLADAYVAAAHQHTSDDAVAFYQKYYAAFDQLFELEPEVASHYINFALALAA